MQIEYAVIILALAALVAGFLYLRVRGRKVKRVAAERPSAAPAPIPGVVTSPPPASQPAWQHPAAPPPAPGSEPSGQAASSTSWGGAAAPAPGDVAATILARPTTPEWGQTQPAGGPVNWAATPVPAEAPAAPPPAAAA
ncbi:MAG TPA: hypothetical protein VK131_03580, partial [Candidatus Acidoferrales bacterium]|nr:hypothetical protein [Candidatus Acidoferrales bacterium]